MVQNAGNDMVAHSARIEYLPVLRNDRISVLAGLVVYFYSIGFD